MPKTVEELILEELKKQDKSVHWLSQQAFVSDMHLHYVLKGRPGEKRPMSPSMLEKINNSLQTDFKLP